VPRERPRTALTPSELDALMTEIIHRPPPRLEVAQSAPLPPSANEFYGPDIDGRVYVPRDLPVGEFVEVKITGYQDYDLLALPKGEKPAEFKVAKQAQ
jgi:hypothetical protein